MKKMRLLLVVAILVASFAISGTAFAFPAGTWVSGISVVNLSSTNTATVVIQFYNEAGAVAFTVNTTIGAGAAKTWYTPAIAGLGATFRGSAVVSSDQPVAATVNTQVPTTGTGTVAVPNRVGTSNSVATPTPLAYATQLMRAYSGWNSYCAVQNAGGAASNITATYYNASGAQVDTETKNVPANASALFDQEARTQLGTFAGSAKFDGGGQNIAVVCNFYNDAADYTRAQFHSYNGFGAGANTVYIPRLVKDYYNYQSGLKVQNVGGAATTVTVTYRFGSNTYTQTSPSIGPNQAWGPYMGSPAQVPMLAGVSGSGSAIIQAAAGGSIVATVNEDNRVNPAGRGVTYSGALAGSGTNIVMFPQIVSKYYGYSSGWQVQNVGGSTAACTATYSAAGSQAAINVPFNVAAGAAFSQFAPQAPGMGLNYNGAVRVSCNQPVVGIGNLSFRSDVDPRYGENYGDSFTTYNGINQ